MHFVNTLNLSIIGKYFDAIFKKYFACQVPVQRVTKYPLLLARLLKVTPGHHKDRENIREAQTRIEAALEQINKDAKEIIAMKGSWKRGGQTNKKGGIQREMNNIRVRKLSLEMLGWDRDETRFALEGRLTFAQVSDSNWKTKLKGTVNSGVKLMTANAMLVITHKMGHSINNNSFNFSFPGGSGPAGDILSSTSIIFPKPDAVSAAVLLLVREKTSRFTTVRVSFMILSSDACITKLIYIQSILCNMFFFDHATEHQFIDQPFYFNSDC